MDSTTSVTSKKTYSIKPTSIQTPQVDTQKKDTTSSNSQSTDIVIQTTKTIENEQAKFKENILRMIQTNFKDLTQEQSNEFAIQLAELRSKLTNKIEFLEYKKSNNLSYDQVDQANLEYFNKIYSFLDSQNINFIKALKSKFEGSNYKDTIISERQRKLDQIEENKTEKKVLKKIKEKNIELKNIYIKLMSMTIPNPQNPQELQINTSRIDEYRNVYPEYKRLTGEINNLNNLLRNPINEKLSSYASQNKDSKLSKIIDNEKEKTQGLSSKALMEPLNLQAINSRIEELRTADIDLKNQINSEDADLLYNIKSLETQIETLKERYLASNDSIKKNEFSNQIKSLEKEFKLKKELLNNLERITQGNMYYQMETTKNFVDNYDTYNKALTSKQINIYKRDYKKLQTIIKEKKLPFNMSRFNIKDPDRVMDLKKQDLKNLRYYLNYINTYYSREHTEYSFIQQVDYAKAKLVTPSHPDGVIVGNNLSQKTLKNLLKLKEETGTVDLSIQQGKIGDCYLLTAMDQILHNEDDLIDFLSCFSEEVVEACDEEGNITTILKRLVFTENKGLHPFKMKFNINEDGSIQLKGYFKNEEKASAGSPIINIAEEIYTQVRFNDMKAHLHYTDPLNKLEFSEENLNTLTFLTNIINVLSNQNSARPEDIDDIIEFYQANKIKFVRNGLKNTKEVLFIEKFIDSVFIKKQADNFKNFSNILKNIDINRVPNLFIQSWFGQIKDPTIQNLLSADPPVKEQREIVIQYSKLVEIQKKINYVIENKYLQYDDSDENYEKQAEWLLMPNQIYDDLKEVDPKIQNTDSYKALHRSVEALLDEDFDFFDSNLLCQSFLNQNSIVHNETLQILVRNRKESSNRNIYNNLLSSGWVHNVLNTFLSSSHESISLNNNPSQNIFNTQYESIQMFQPENFTPSIFDLRETIMPNSYKKTEHKFYETEYDKANFGLYQANADRNKLGLISSHAINSEGILNGIDFNINPWDNDMVLLRTVEQYNQLKEGMDISITRRKKV